MAADIAHYEDLDERTGSSEARCRLDPPEALDSVSSPITRRVYNLGLYQFFRWYTLEPHLA